MDRIATFDARARQLLAVIGLCAFMAVFSAVDSGEQYRAWSAARGWTPEQRVTAQAVDAERMAGFAFAALGAQAFVIVASFAAGLSLGMAIAMDSIRAYGSARWCAAAALAGGLAYAKIEIIYLALLDGRRLMKGPVFDYALGWKPPVALAVAGFVALAAAAAVSAFRACTGTRERR